MTEANPCPNCGETNIVYEENSDERAYVYCPGCGAQGPTIDPQAIIDFATERWNKLVGGH
jgi:endogenous inhibitor of DNA gyrase (YacG/DUF329 family)